MNIQTIQADLALLTDWEDRYGYIIDLGHNLPEFPQDQKTDANKVRGCTSRVWLIAEKGQGGTHTFQAEADALIVQGLLYVLFALYNGKTAQEIQTINAAEELEKLNLGTHLSPNRRSGFVAVAEKIKHLTKEG